MLRDWLTWLGQQPENVANLLTAVIMVILGGIGTLLWTLALWATRRLSGPSPEEQAASDSRRPWLHIVERGIDEETGRLRIVIVNTGATPAFSVTVRDWCEISKPTQSVSYRLRSRWWELWLPSRQSVERRMHEDLFALEHGGRDSDSGATTVHELRPGVPLVHMLTDNSSRLVERFNLDMTHRQLRHAGEVTYTDRTGRLRPDFPFCFQELRLAIGDRQHRLLHECLDPKRNGSR